MTEREALSTARALKQALEALEFIPKSGSMLGAQAEAKRLEAITAIKEALAQPEQEPVAWRNAAIRVGEDLCSVGPFGYYDMTAEQWLDWALSVVTVHAPPPQRTWVGLSDEEIDKIYEAHHNQYGECESVNFGYERAIEAKLKEKNT